MSRLTNTAFALSLVTLAPAGAADTSPAEKTRQGSTVPVVISVAYSDPSIATSARDVARQSGFKVAGATRWPAASPDRPAVAFTAPGAISLAYRDPRIATGAAEVLRQGGLATAGVVRWVPDAPVVADAQAATVKLGAL